MLLAVAAEVAWSSPVDFSSEDSRLHDAIRSEVGLGGTNVGTIEDCFTRLRRG